MKESPIAHIGGSADRTCPLVPPPPLPSTGMEGVVPVEGGVPLVEDGEVVGALGVSGGVRAVQRVVLLGSSPAIHLFGYISRFTVWNTQQHGPKTRRIWLFLPMFPPFFSINVTKFKFGRKM